MKKSLLPLLSGFLFLAAPAFAQLSTPPKFEFRGAWIATVINLDWPSTPGLPAEVQKVQLIRILDQLQETGINAVMFQIRCESDAFYESSYDPWSYWLTGQQGAPPQPYYDPLEFAIEEAHKRGIELHAWFNPYRAEREVGNYVTDARHVTRAHPDWILNFGGSGGINVVNPGLREVRQYVTNVVMDVVTRYDVDGVHFDDYFYPYPPNQISNEDIATFNADPRGFTNIGDWRRDNVNLMVKMVHDSIQAVKPYVKFGISPFGIWRNGVPPGIVGLDAYNVIYADALAWLNQQTVDYITPQLYWPFGGGQDYGRLVSWWAGQAIGRHFYPGQAVWRITSWPDDEMRRQMNLNRLNYPLVYGSVFFRAQNLDENPKGFTTLLQEDFYRYPALPPGMDWKEQTPPNGPANLRHELVAEVSTHALAWDVPDAASDGEVPRWYAVYRFTTPRITDDKLDDPANLAIIDGRPFSLTIPPADAPRQHFYTVTAVDRNGNESGRSATFAISAPATPAPQSPADDGIYGSPLLELEWSDPGAVTYYSVQVGQDSTFVTGVLAQASDLIAPAFAYNGLEAQQRYFWRVRAANAGGTSDYSATHSFFTGFPVRPLLASPTNRASNLPQDVTLVWRTTENATAYNLQVATSLSFDSTSIIVQMNSLADTSYTVEGLAPETFHYWRVSASNDVGTGNWSQGWVFKTAPATSVADAGNNPDDYALLQNYPNPFNPTTTIVLRTGGPGHVKLEVFNVVGQVVDVLLDRYLQPGRHEVVFNGATLASGVYYYRMVTKGQVFTRKLLLMK